MGYEIMLNRIHKLVKSGVSNGVFELIKEESIEVDDFSYLGIKIDSAVRNCKRSSPFLQMHALSRAVNQSSLSAFRSWVVEKVKKMCEPIKSEQDEISITSKCVAELVSAGLLSEVFDEIELVKERKQEKTPDFSLGGHGYVEVYCPQESQVKNKKGGSMAILQEGDFRYEISRPLTGPKELALKYSSNKVIDKVLNDKREKDQTIADEVNILWVDLMNGLELSAKSISPYEVYDCKGEFFVGNVGVWHAFYGKEGSSKLAKERFSLRFSGSLGMVYYQQKEGLFRERKSLSAALLLTKNGVALFENPWALKPIEDGTKKKIRDLYKFRPDISFFGVGKNIGEERIESVLQEIEWLYENA